MSRSSLLSVFLSLAATLGGCSRERTPAWAREHATVEVSDDGGGIEGYQTWEFYTEAWADDQDDAEHICARVQSIEGVAESDMPEGCPGCVASYALTLTELDTDCEEPEASADTYAGTTRYAIGAVATRLTDDDPHPGDSQGWYGGWGGTEVEALGFAWNEAIDQGDEPDLEGWAAGESYTLSPGYVWKLSGKQAGD